jgi:quercetin dioxygenase-like cupin family protein
MAAVILCASAAGKIRWVRRPGTWLLCVLLLQSGGGLTEEAVSRPVPIIPADQHWQSPPGIEGVEFAWMLGSAGASGDYVLRVRLVDGALIPPHTHPDARITTVMSGTLHVGFSAQFDAGLAERIPAGAVYVAPAGVAHFVWAGGGEVVYQESGTGPTANVFLSR